MIGCREDAELIGQWDDYYPLPDGWDKVGEGDERIAYLSPDGIVYKVELTLNGANTTEYFNICQIQLLEPVENWRVPEASLYVLDKFHSVIAMEYIQGTGAIFCQSTYRNVSCTCNEFPCVGIEWEMIGELWGITDLHSDNIRQLPDGTKVLVDVTR